MFFELLTKNFIALRLASIGCDWRSKVLKRKVVLVFIGLHLFLKLPYNSL